MGKTDPGRGAVDWREHYESRMVTPEAIVEKVASGDRVYIATGHECPALVGALLGRAYELKGVQIRRISSFWEDYGIFTDEWSSTLRLNVSFATPSSRSAIAEGIVDYTVVGFGDLQRHIDQGRSGSTGYDHCWFTATPPDENGFCSVGAELWDLKTGMAHSKVKAVGINSHLPRTFGDTLVHVSEIDCFFNYDEPAAHRMRRGPGPAAKAIAQHVSTLVCSGDTVEIGAGTTTFALAELGAFDGKEDIGFFSETAAPGILDLVKRGIVTSKRATLHPGKFVTTGLTALGPEDWDYVNENPFFEFHNYDYVLNPTVIAQNDNMVAINNALAIDLKGQVAVSSIGPRLLAGSGGQLSFHTGAFLSKGGRAVTVLPSTTSEGSVSRIVHQHPQGQVVTVPWDLADTVVTEYGVAELLGKTMRERAEALIAIAHPDQRPELEEAARNL
ncbi:MAG TPA: acetyl-CoA hydrolase/transferase C-terminal domain-containing protein [Amycolatopsis sp.]|uniref:acetyl-CoA hydrolase/transferase family protein n=1 Tax=Amycolatopsis sp. TaxID=37632 RepID=UPI002B46D34D|nr:acetyl-CoA hydrolase/transferase C-terminal domain-containing protein [Amycolatopsis sp.]HKS47009.1 acetyl-CoA hydrolase/transferase C-terminal domain-containing protein [Amycolatopsis sp.]